MSVRKFFRRAQWDRERAAEIESYIQIETDDNIARGMTEAEARAAARRKFGHAAGVREEIYRMNTVQLWDSVSRDLRYGLRMLRHNPTFTAVALLTLALGIGANTAVFSVVNSVLIKPLAYPKPEELVAVWQKAPGAAGLANISGDLRMSASMFLTYSEKNQTLAAMGGYNAVTAAVTGMAEPEQVRAVVVTEGALEALAVPPAAGRWLSKADQKPGSSVIMLSYGYWQRRFGGAASVIGRNLMVDSRLREIVGVMPRGFRFVNEDFDLLMPFVFDRAQVILPGFFMRGVARLKPGVTVAQANADLTRLAPVWMDSWPPPPGVNPHVWEIWRISGAMRPLKDDVVGSAASILWVVMATIGIVMLIACANVANLLLVRAEARQQELAVRAALGAGWGQIVRALLLESVLLACMGGALGVAVAYAGLRWLVAIGAGRLPRTDEIAVDGWALAFAVTVSLVSGLLFGLAPALKYAGPRIAMTLRGGGRTASVGRERYRARNVLVVAQVALALVLLISSGLMIRTFVSVRSVDPGFARPEGIQMVRIVAPPPTVMPDPERVARMQNEMLDRLAAIPGVKQVAFASEMPMDGIGTDWDTVLPEGKFHFNGAMPPLRTFHYVSPGVFAAMGTRMIAGREFTWTDLYGRRPVAIVSESLAREFWGSAGAAVGKRLAATMPNSPLRAVVGVVQDVRENGLQEPAPTVVYWPSFTDSLYRSGREIIARGVTFAIRSSRAGTEGLVQDVQRAVWSVNATLPLANVQTMREVYDRSMARTSFTLVMLGIAGAMALVLGIVGIYGVISYAVTQRRREIGIRVALGAQLPKLRRMFVRDGLALVAVGTVIGLIAAAALMGLMKSLLFGVSAMDPATYVAVPLVLAAAAAVASYVPARRVSKADPVEALRAE
jgi:predicted permease